MGVKRPDCQSMETLFPLWDDGDRVWSCPVPLTEMMQGMAWKPGQAALAADEGFVNSVERRCEYLDMMVEPV